MSISSFLRPAWRSLVRAPAFTITASATLVIGIGAAIAIFTLVNGVLLRPLPYGEPDRIVGAWHDLKGINMPKGNQTAATYFSYKRLARTIENIGVYQEDAVNVSDPTGGAAPQRVTSAWISAGVIPVLRVVPLRGRNFTEAEDLPKGPNVVIISEGIWRSRFGSDPQVLERTLEVNGQTRQIVGVMPARFRFPNASTQIWLPVAIDPTEQFYGGFNYDGIARLKPGVSIATAERDFAAILPRTPELFPMMAPGVPTQMILDQAKPAPRLVPHKEDVVGGIAKTLWIVAAAAGLVLLVACANVTNLILVRADARQRELAVREAIGASRIRVLMHFFAESAVITAVAAVVGLGLATLAIRVLVSAGPVEIPRLAEIGIDGTTIAFTIIVTILVAVLCSVIPSLRLARMRLSIALREGGRGGTASRVQQRVRSTLVAAQIAFALVALAGSGLLVRTFLRLNEVRPGFNAEKVAMFWLSLPTARYPNDTVVVRFFTELLDRVQSLPGVQSAGITSRVPLVARGQSSNAFFPEDDPASYANKIPPLQTFITTDGGYFRTMEIPLLAGRTFDRLERQSSRETIISQATAIQFYKDSTGQRAIGQRFRTLPNGEFFTVVGVVGSTRDTALAAPGSQTVYFPQVPASNIFSEQTRRTMALLVRTAGEPTSITRAVQTAVRELDATLPLFDVRSMTVTFRASMAQLSFTIIVLGAAAVVTLLLGAIGLYGVMAYIVTLRTRELGVRIALGASPQGVVAMLTKQGVILTAFGIAGGLALFAVVARFLRTFLFGVAPTDVLTLVSASALLVAIATLASWIPARRTAKLDPANVLRAE